jgi:hypothetical protein
MEGLNFVDWIDRNRAALGIGRMVVQQWTLLLVSQNRKNQTAISYALKNEVSLHYLLLKIQKKTIVTTVGCNYCFYK